MSLGLVYSYIRVGREPKKYRNQKTQRCTVLYCTVQGGGKEYVLIFPRILFCLSQPGMWEE